jgi:serine/threonine protein kinase
MKTIRHKRPSDARLYMSRVSKTRQVGKKSKLVLTSYHISNMTYRGDFYRMYSAFSNYGEEYQCKVIDKSALLKNSGMPEVVNTEISILNRTWHPNLIAMQDVFEDINNIYLFLESHHGLSLSRLIRQKGPFSEEIVSKWMMQIICGLKYLQNRGIVHRNLTAAHIYVNKDGIVKIGNFDMAAIIGESKIVKQRGADVHYQAPETLVSKKYSFGTDIWSLGILMYYLLVGRLPFTDENQCVKGNKAVEKNIIIGCYDLPPSLSSQARHLIEQMLQFDPTQRPSINDLLIHPFFH